MKIALKGYNNALKIALKRSDQSISYSSKARNLSCGINILSIAKDLPDGYEGLLGSLPQPRPRGHTGSPPCQSVHSFAHFYLRNWTVDCLWVPRDGVGKHCSGE